MPNRLPQRHCGFGIGGGQVGLAIPLPANHQKPFGHHTAKGLVGYPGLPILMGAIGQLLQAGQHWPQPLLRYKTKGQQQFAQRFLLTIRLTRLLRQGNRQLVGGNLFGLQQGLAKQGGGESCQQSCQRLTNA